MKIRKTAFLAVLMLACLACAPKAGNTQPVETPEEDNKPVIKEMKEIDSTGFIRITKYDEHGNETEKEFYNEKDGLTDVYTTTYDENGNKLTEVHTDSAGTIKRYTKYVYDKDGNLLEEYMGDNEEELIIQKKNTYKSGKLVKNIDYSFDGDVFHINVYEYNDKGLVTLWSVESEDGYVYRTYEYEYDKDGNKTKMTDTMYGKCPHIYFYDSEERVIREEYYGEDGELSFAIDFTFGKYGIEEAVKVGDHPSHSVIEYENDGKTSKEYSIEEDGSKKQTSIHEYDENGNLLYYCSDKDSLTGYSEFSAEYNEYGDPVKIYRFNNYIFRDSPPVDETTEYEYIYY